ncbi:MAG: MATE family efflux transporter [Oscillospiraceae bacterium]|nr:MATE family efflux transporter [Oscillospiraceae bacterium]
MHNTETRNDRMMTMPVSRLMLSMGIPMILSMVLQAVYNIVDSAFVSNMQENGEQALTALGLAFPVQMLMVAVGIGTGVGVNALAAKYLGQNHPESAGKAAGNALFMAGLIFLAFLLFGIAGTEPYIASQHSNAVSSGMAIDYLKICCIGSAGIVFFSIFEKLLQAAGHSLHSTIAQIAGAVVNMILDPILIYGWAGFPECGVKGAAYATVIGQIVSCILALIFHIRINQNIRIKAEFLKPSFEMIKQIYAIGIPAIIAQALMSVMTYGLNIILGKISDSMVTAYSLYYKVQQFVLFAAFGLRDAITPVISYAHGMKNHARIRDGVKYGLLYTLVIMMAGLLIIELFAVPFTGIFGISGETETFFISAMRIISVSFLFAGANIAFQGIFQAMDGGKESLMISILRQILFILPVAWLMIQIAQTNSCYWLVWMTFPFAELVTAGIAIVLYRSLRTRKLK